MKVKNCFKRVLSVGLASLMLLTSAVAVSAENDVTSAAQSTPAAANMSGKTLTMDGVRNANEGWTELPNLVVDQQSGYNPIKVWLGTDGTYLYTYVEIANHKAGDRRIALIQFDFLNTHDEKDSDGNAKWTSETYRKMLGQESNAGTKSASVCIEFRWANNPQGYPYGMCSAELYRLARKDGSKTPTNANAYLGIGEEGHPSYTVLDETVAKAEFRVELNDEIKTALKNGTYTIGVGAVYGYGTRAPNWWYEDVMQYDPDTLGGWLNDDSAKEGKPVKTLEPALLPDIVLPCMNVEMIGYQTGVQSEKGAVRFIGSLPATADYTDYEEIGFDVTYGNVTKTVNCTTVYNSITADYGTKLEKSADYGAGYLFALTIKDLDFDTDYAFTVKPWAKRMGGDTVYGKEATVNVKVADPGQNNT